jgi:hypothetical protein
MSVGFREPQQPTRPPSRADLRVRVLWRLRGPSRVVAAALYRHPAGTELAVYMEPENVDDVLETRVALNVVELEQRADVLKGMLIEKGWLELTATG